MSQLRPWPAVGLAVILVACLTNTFTSPTRHAAPLSGDPTPIADVLKKGDRICVLGSAIADRMQHDGWLETELTSRRPDLELSIRHLGFSADELTVQQRTSGFGTVPKRSPPRQIINSGPGAVWHQYMGHCEADVIFGFFGYVESFAGAEGVAKFEGDLADFIRTARSQKYNGSNAPRIVLFTPIPFEDLGSRHLPNGQEDNQRIALYAAAIRKVAAANDVPCVDLFESMNRAYAAEDKPLTANGMHLTEYGNRVLGKVIADALVAGDQASATTMAKVREAVLEKNLLWHNRYRATDGFNVYGGRSSLTYNGFSNFDVLQRELQILDVMADNRDKKIWARARGKDLAVDDSNAPARILVPTNKPGKGPDGAHEYLDGTEAISQMTIHSGMEINLWADEKQFPILQNPVQMAWDTKGRLWVAAWPTYPHWAPGDPMNDKLLVIEDTDNDGKADTCTAFADDLHNPTGFEFWNGGVFVATAPDLLFLKDTDGDGKADVKERILHGLSSADTHHTANSFEIGPDGALYFQEGTFHMSQVESIHGPVRNRNGCVWRFEPRTWRVERHIPYNFANPHGHVFDAWGQNFMTDGTGNVNYYALPFSGHIQHPDKHSGYFSFFKQRSRPCAGTEILSSQHFPGDVDGNLLIANVIGFQGIFNYRFVDQGSGFTAEEAEPIVHSKDHRFRPADIEIGPDGAIYFLDWYNPIIGHMQHHLRDPSRDHSHGRIYRVTAKGRAPTKLAPIDGQPIEALLDLLKRKEYRVRSRARIELSERESDAVLAAASAWAKRLDENDPDFEHHLLEIAWLHQQHDAVHRGALTRLLASKDHRPRAAATRIVRCMRHRLPEAIDLLLKSSNDPHPRVRLEAVVAASFFTDPAAVRVALNARKQETDKFLNYALKETMRALDSVWRAGLKAGTLQITDSDSVEYLLGLVGASELVMLPKTDGVLQAMVSRAGVSPQHRREAAEELAKKRGTSAANVVLDAVRKLDRRGGTVGSVLDDLSVMLQGLLTETPRPERSQLLSLAEKGRRAQTRQMGYAALIALDDGIDAAWTAAATSREGLVAFLGALPTVADASIRAAAYERVRPLMFQAPASLRTGDGNAPTPGIEVAFFRGTPKNAHLDTFRALKAETSGRVKNIGLNIPQIRRRDEFGLLFTGTIEIPRDGRWTFFTNSDDGSRLYIDGEEVVNNDGAHAMKEKRGALRLNAGSHTIAVTYYDQGGGDGLAVSWRGPGVKKQRIPDNALYTNAIDPIRGAAVRAMASIPGHDEERFSDAARLIGEGLLVRGAVGILEKTPKGRWPAKQVEPVIDSIAGYVAGLAPTARTAPDALAAIEQGRRLTTALSKTEADARRRMLAGLGGTTLLIRTLPHQMKYDRRSFKVAKGKPVAIVFQNNDVMPHNLVVTAPGALKAVGERAEAMADSAREYIPPMKEVLWNTRMILPGETTRLTFVAPQTTGSYPFVCTFPGHWRVMNGTMEVVDELSAADIAAAPIKVAPSAPARRFVKMWKLEDLLPALKGDWRKMRQIERGKTMFTEAGCAKCHKFGGLGVQSAPDITKIGDKYQGAELLKHILDPSLSIQEGYENWMIETEDEVYDGIVVKEDATTVKMRPNLQNPKEDVVIKKSDITDRTKMSSSSMPTGLLVTLNQREILDLLAFLESGKSK